MTIEIGIKFRIFFDEKAVGQKTVDETITIIEEKVNKLLEKERKKGLFDCYDTCKSY